jgi:nucleotide-binding universal stress UspA family protein
MKKILICTDGSDYSLEAYRCGAWLAKDGDCAIDLLYVSDLRQFEVSAVADVSGSLGIQPYEGMVSQMHEVERLKSDFIKDQAQEFFEAAGLSERVKYHHETGMLVDLIGRYESQADLVILGKRGESAHFAKEHIGSMLERVVRATHTPCLVTSRPFKPIQQVAVAFDGGASTLKALDFLAAVEPFRSLEIHLLSVAEGYPETPAVQALSKAREIMEGKGLTPKSQLLTGEVGLAIADYVRDTEVDMLVLGAYGHSRIRELLIGSTTTELLRSCHVPVLCFR